MSRNRGLVCLTALLLALALAVPAASQAGTANAGLPGASPTNPLSGVRWSVFQTDNRNPTNDAPSAYFQAARSADHRAAFRRILDRPRFRWFGSWNPVFDRNGGNKPGARNVIRFYSRGVTGGDPDVGVQVAVFRLQPFERAACRRLPTDAEKRDYRRWIDEFAHGLGSTRTALVLQPDMPFALCAPGRSRVYMNLVAWAARRLNALPHTTIYIDAGAADWSKAGAMATVLRRSGVRHARGFALNVTHYDSTRRQIGYGRKILRALRRRGIRGKAFVINTAQNGRPFIAWRHRRAFRIGSVCPHPGARRCTTLGAPPTTDTVVRGVDALLWIGRPWLANTRVRGYFETLRLIRSSPFL